MTGASSSISVLPGWSHVIISTETLVGKGLKSRLGGGSGISIGAWWLCENTGCDHRQALRGVVKYYQCGNVYYTYMYYTHCHSMRVQRLRTKSKGNGSPMNTVIEGETHPPSYGEVHVLPQA